jgi:hypothetical protein
MKLLLPLSSHDVPDDLDARLVVIGTEHPYSREAGNDAEVFVKSDIGVTREFTASLSQRPGVLGSRQESFAGPRRSSAPLSRVGVADGTVTARIPETYQWLRSIKHRVGPAQDIDLGKERCKIGAI